MALQYQQSQKFLAYLNALLAAPNELEAVLQTLALQTDIDQAEGVNLDTLGELVGVGRIIPASVAVKFFGFEGQPGSDAFGEEDALSIGSRFREEAESSTATSVLADPEYRLLIRAKIVKNHATGTGNDLLAGLAYLFDTAQVSVEDSGGMAISIGIGRQLTYQEKALIETLDILPRPAAVRISQRVTYSAADYFGFEEMNGATGFGEEGSTATGGQFAEEF